MKHLHEYETPETDASIHGAEIYASDLCDKCRDLERRLAACRERLSEIAKTSSSSRIKREARETLALTDPQ